MRDGNRDGKAERGGKEAKSGIRCALSNEIHKTRTHKEDAAGCRASVCMGPRMDRDRGGGGDDEGLDLIDELVGSINWVIDGFGLWVNWLMD